MAEPPSPRERCRTGIGGHSCAALVLLASAGPLGATGFLGIPRTIDGYPTNVGLLVLGHSTSAQGQYPAKLVDALNDDSNVLDGRFYAYFPAITGGDGGLLWSRISVDPADLQYDRITASPGVGEGSQPQWCEAGDGARWSCRRSRAEETLTGVFPIPDTGGCADPSVDNGCRAPATRPCTWFDRSRPLAENPVTETMSPHSCWQKMDYRLALIQDTSNRSWPIDDFTTDGSIAGDDLWPASRIQRTRAWPCGGTSGVIGGAIDWNCDQLLDTEDAAHTVYAGWLRTFAEELLDDDRYDYSLDHVFVSHKPVEMGQCSLYPPAEQSTCLTNPHALRSGAQIAATPDRPFDHYYLPTVFWEHRSVEALFDDLGLDPRVHAATAESALAMWDRSVACFDVGLGSDDWRIPSQVSGRPDDVAADDSEIDGGPTPDANLVGCMVADHIHHNEAGGWMMADVWYAGLAPNLWSGIFTDGFETGNSSGWTSSPP